MAEELIHGHLYKIFRGGGERTVLYIGTNTNRGIKKRHTILTRYSIHSKTEGSSVHAYRFREHNIKEGRITAADFIYQMFYPREEEFAEELLQKSGI